MMAMIRNIPVGDEVLISAPFKVIQSNHREVRVLVSSDRDDAFRRLDAGTVDEGLAKIRNKPRIMPAKPLTPPEEEA